MDGRDVLGRRVAAALVDLFVLFAVFIVVAAVGGDAGVADGEASAAVQGTAALVYVGLALLYYFAGEATSGQTPGKRLLGVRVVDAETGRRAGVGRIALRTLLRPVDNLPGLYLLGFLVVILTGRRRARLGDLAGRTAVVSAR